MFLLTFLNSVADLGVKKNYLPWEAHLTRKLNLSALLGSFNLIVSSIFFLSIGYYNSIFEFLVVMILAPLVFYSTLNSDTFSPCIFLHL